jgi:hypothetical protein
MTTQGVNIRPAKRGQFSSGVDNRPHSGHLTLSSPLAHATCRHLIGHPKLAKLALATGVGLG